MRSLHVAKTISEQINAREINSAGLVMGTAHYNEVTASLNLLGIGHATFFLGKPRDSEKSLLDYSLRF